MLHIFQKVFHSFYINFGTFSAYVRVGPTYFLMKTLINVSIILKNGHSRCYIPCPNTLRYLKCYIPCPNTLRYLKCYIPCPNTLRYLKCYIPCPHTLRYLRCYIPCPHTLRYLRCYIISYSNMLNTQYGM